MKCSGDRGVCFFPPLGAAWKDESYLSMTIGNIPDETLVSALNVAQTGKAAEIFVPLISSWEYVWDNNIHPDRGARIPAHFQPSAADFETSLEYKSFLSKAWNLGLIVQNLDMGASTVKITLVRGCPLTPAAFE